MQAEAVIQSVIRCLQDGEAFCPKETIDEVQFGKDARRLRSVANKFLNRLMQRRAVTRKVEPFGTVYHPVPDKLASGIEKALGVTTPPPSPTKPRCPATPRKPSPSPRTPLKSRPPRECPPAPVKRWPFSRAGRDEDAVVVQPFFLPVH